MQIGITGANGFIGNHLIRSALAKGHRPALFLQSGSSTRPIDDVLGSCEAFWGDLLEPESLEPFLRRSTAVFHLAGLNRYWSKDPRDFHRINIEGALNVARGCSRNGIEKLVHVSSCITLGASDRPVSRNEESEFNLHGIRFLYGETKAAGEFEVRSWARTSGLPTVIVNPASAVGERDHGPTPIGKPISDICRGLWPVYVAGGACFIDVRDVIHGLWLALEKGRTTERYCLAGDNLTNRQFMTLVARFAGVAAPRFKMPRLVLEALAGGTEWTSDWLTHREPMLTRGMSALVGRYLYFDGTKARRELGFAPGPSAAGIERCVRWFQATHSGARAWS
jgi:dihydroflavonol-4-reductase